MLHLRSHTHIGNMENITLPPTRLDVVRVTLVQSQTVASECGEKCVIVTYDIATATPALQMQAQASQKFDSIFICFGAFHISTAFLTPLGYILDSSGCPEILPLALFLN